MRRLLGVVACFVLLASAPAGRASDGYSFPGDAPYSVPKEKMDEALECRRGDELSPHGVGALDGSGRKHPVLLVHGTGITRGQSWQWNYWPLLNERGWEVCWVRLPKGALADIQVSSEYVARAVARMHRRTGERIDVIGHSQGGLQPRWAIKWFPAGRFVADYIGLASPNHGTQVADVSSNLTDCFEACWQMRTDSNFIEALNRGGHETPGPINYTNVYTQFDELVQPVGTQELDGGKNYLVQDICPGRPVDHLAILGDYVTFRLVLDALKNPGPALRERAFDDQAAACTRDRMPGAGEEPDGLLDLADFENDGSSSDAEPPLKPYARP
jgi:triacylglycerol lipase